MSRPVALPLGTTAARGMLWISAAAFAMKIVALGVQFALAKLLDEKAFGAIALAYTVAFASSAIANAGVSEVLIQRDRKIHLWINPAFWLTLTTGLLAAILTVAAGPVSSRIYAEPLLPGLLAVLAAGILIDNLSTVPVAILNLRLQFRTIAAIAVAGHALTSVLTVLFAWWGFGAYSFVWPFPIQAGVFLLVRWALTLPKLKPRLQVRRWKLLGSDSTAALGVRLLTDFFARADVVFLGLFYATGVVGIYYFGVNMAVQVARLAMGNMAGVLYPTLIKLQNEPARQIDATLRTARLLVIVLTPIFVIQALVADPLQRVLFDQKWADAVPVLQILSIGLALTSAGLVSEPLLRARGQFVFYLRFMLCITPLYLIAMAVGAYTGGAVGTAVGTAVAWFIQRSICGAYLLAREGVPLRRFMQLHVTPFAAITVSVIAAAPVLWLWPLRPAISLFVVPVIVSTVYSIIEHRIDPTIMRDLRRRLFPSKTAESALS